MERDDAERERQRAEVRELCARLDLTPTELARKAGVVPSTLNRFLNKNVTHMLSARTLARLRNVAGGINHPGIRQFIDGEAKPLQKQVGDRFGPEDLPVLGYGQGGADGFFFDNGIAQTYIARPAELLRVASAYAIFMHGHSMDPRFHEGEVLYVNPIRPPKSGDYVVIEFKDGRGLVKRLVRRTARAIIVEQYNPKKTFEIAPDEVKAIHLIVSSSIG
ncbi:MAG: helix-turn-helix transcriptional regulator [Rhodocyclaceae bacterium]|nr:helix-turn-helix transcriptional regulator [Rhodocyclaceae bacterium]